MDSETKEKIWQIIHKISDNVCNVYQDRLCDLESEFLDDDGNLDENNEEFCERKENLDEQFDYLLTIDSKFDFKGDVQSQIKTILASADELKINRSYYPELCSGLDELEKICN